MAVAFVYNTVGKQLCIYKGYSFFPNSKKSAMCQYWRCTRKSSNCKATLSTTHHGDLIRTHEGHNHYPPRFVIRNGWVRNQSGKQLILLFNYTFYFDSRNSWRCTKGSSSKARIVLDNNLEIVKANIPTSKKWFFSWVKNVNGKQLAVIHGFPFYLNSKGGKFWRCLKTGYCRAHFSIDTNWRITTHNLSHNHDPPKHIIRNGVYIKI
ncbi:FLYWCH zinc finger domain-containing protein [Phthorimaea operculella]|nr:FLYWCH zinc finger domain-containing protein [Phthorimaea operculella]